MPDTKDNTVTTFTFECSYGDIETAENPKMKVKEPGVYLHFLRYGLFDKKIPHEETKYVDYQTNLQEEEKLKKEEEERQALIRIQDNLLEKRLVKIDSTYVATPKQQGFVVEEEIELDEVVVVGKKHKIEGLPELENFYHSKTSLNEGYLYLINDSDPSDYYEMFVDEEGLLQHINWQYSKNIGADGNILDVRIPEKTEKKKAGKRIDPPGKRLWVAYSIAQWSREYHEMMLNDTELRQKRMKLIRCDALLKGEERQKESESEILPIPYVNAYGIYADKNDIRGAKLYKTLNDIHLDEKKEDDKGENDEYQDLFFVIDDPLGMAQDVAEVLNVAHDKHRATVESMQTGEAESTIFNRLQTQPDAHSDFISKEYGQQANALFTNALTIHSFINASPDIEKEYGEYVDFEKINTILGFDYRAVQRNRITSLRKDYLEIIKSDFYKPAFCDGLRGSDQDTFENRSIIASQLSLLTEHPQHKDRFLDPVDKYEGKNDQDFDDFIASSVNTNDEFYQLLTKEINIDKITQSTLAAKAGFKLFRRANKSLKDVTTAYTRHAVRTQNFLVIDKTIKAFKDSNGWNIKIKTENATNALAKTGFGLGLKAIEETPDITFGKKGKIIKIRTSRNVAKLAENTKSVTLPGKGLGTKTSTLLKEILDSPRFRKWMAGLELINTLIKFKSLNDKGNLKNYTSFTGASSSLTSAVLAYQEASLKVAGSSDDVVITLGKVGRVTGLIGSAVSVGMCVVDTIESIQLNDNDAAAAWAFTAVVSGVLLVDSIAFTISWWGAVSAGGLAAGGTASGLLTGGLTIVLTILFVGGIALALYLTDTPLEKYIKNNILSNENTWDYSRTNIPYAYIKELYNNKKHLVDNEVARWRDFVVASDDLYDLLISYKVDDNINPSDLVNPNKKVNPSWGEQILDFIRSSLTPDTLVPTKFTITIALRKFIYDKSEFRFAIALFPKEVKFNTQQKPIFLTHTKTKLREKDGVDVLEIVVEVKEPIQKQIGLGSEFIFFSNTLVNEQFGEYWPSQRGTTRYHAFKFAAFEKQVITESQAKDELISKLSEKFSNYLGENVRVGTSHELIQPITWK